MLLIHFNIMEEIHNHFLKYKTKKIFFRFHIKKNSEIHSNEKPV